MKKILAVLMALTIVFAFAGCASKQYEDKVVTIPVTDENGETVTDKDGNTVTEISTTAPASTDKKDDKSTTKATGTTKAKDNKTTAKSTTKKKSDKKTTNKKDKKTTTKKATTTKPQKRDIKLTVEIPFYNNQETRIKIKYKAKNDKKWSELEFEKDEDKLVLDQSPLIVEYTIKDVKDYVDFEVELEGIDVRDNTTRVKATSKKGYIKLVTGIEVLAPPELQ